MRAGHSTTPHPHPWKKKPPPRHHDLQQEVMPVCIRPHVFLEVFFKNLHKLRYSQHRFFFRNGLMDSILETPDGVSKPALSPYPASQCEARPLFQDGGFFKHLLLAEGLHVAEQSGKWLWNAKLEVCSKGFSGCGMQSWKFAPKAPGNRDFKAHNRDALRILGALTHINSYFC